MNAESRLLILRHAIAQDRDEAARAGIDEAGRPLTEKGRRRMRRIAAGMQELVGDIGLIASSPYTRALQTADLLAEAYPEASREVIDELRPGHDPEGVLAWLRRQQRGPVVAVIGHEPDLGGLASYALAGGSRSFVNMKKAGACLVTFGGGIRAGMGELQWLVPPRVTRRLAGGG